VSIQMTFAEVAAACLPFLVAAGSRRVGAKPSRCPAAECEYAAAVVPTVTAALLAVGPARSVPLVSRCVANGAWLAWGAPHMPVPQREQLLRRLLTACPADTVAVVDLTNADVRRGACRVDLPTDVIATVVAAHGASLQSLVLDGPRQSYHLRLLLRARPAAANIRNVTMSGGIAGHLLVQVVTRCPRLETLCAPHARPGILLTHLARLYGVYQTVSDADARYPAYRFDGRLKEPFVPDPSAPRLPLPALRDVTFTITTTEDFIALFLYLPWTVESLSLMRCHLEDESEFFRLRLLWPFLISLRRLCVHGDLPKKAFESLRTMLRWASSQGLVSSAPRLRSFSFCSRAKRSFDAFTANDLAALGSMAPNLLKLCVSPLASAAAADCLRDTIPNSFPSCVHLELPHATAWLGRRFDGNTLPVALIELLERMPGLRRIRVAHGDISARENPGGFLYCGVFWRGCASRQVWDDVAALRRLRGLPRLRVLPEWNLE
jgi:hypothetical protein